ncbi:MAG: ATP synthase F1 subunit gamma, partial [Gemmataceae bacterium]|nr:ATP synthase F1 subunit gamma [Gemmataceae bacterium]
KAVRNIRKITRTMELIATTRFQRALKRALEADAYTRKIAEITADLSHNLSGEISHPLLVSRPVRKGLLLVITANRGLCGGYNASILREAQAAIQRYQQQGIPFELEVAGKRGITFFRFQRLERSREYTHFEDRPAFAEVEVLASRYIELYSTAAVDEVKVAYMKFHNAARQEAVVETLLPLGSLTIESRRGTPVPPTAASTSPSGSTRWRIDYEFLPDAQEILAELVPTACKVRLFKCFLDAAVSEQIARRIAMKAATENAGELIKEITRLYNRTRQANITREITELITSAEALK